MFTSDAHSGRHCTNNGSTWTAESTGAMQLQCLVFFVILRHTISFWQSAAQPKATLQLKQNLIQKLSSLQKNGKDTPSDVRKDIDLTAALLEKNNPTSKPAKSEKMDGFWRMLYTDFAPAAPSSGQLGPFNGDVFQDLDSKNNLIRNILRIDFPPLRGALRARQSILNDNTWQIEFIDIENKLAGVKIQEKAFSTKEVRNWKITFLDDDFRILRARRPESPENDSFIFIFKRDESAR